MAQKPTIAELEKVMNDPTADIEIGPDGSLVGSEFRKELEALLNRHSKENGSNTPDFVLAGYLMKSLWIFDTSVQARDRFYGIAPAPGVSGTGQLQANGLLRPAESHE